MPDRVDRPGFRGRKAIRKPVVLTIHGARPRSGWQAAVHRVLDPHFTCLEYSYDDYDHVFGTLAVIVDLRWTTAATCMAVLTVAAHWPVSVLSALVAFGCLAVAIQKAKARRADCADRLADWMTSNSDGRPPHVIADSFGSYLVGTAVRDRSEVTVRHAVFASSPLPRHYPWASLVASLPKSAAKVRSEIAKSDFVAMLMYLVGWIADDLGDAGSRGFENSLTVHTAFVNGSCEECKTQRTPAAVHNVRLKSRRGLQLRSAAYVERHWLPFLWNIPIVEFATLLETLHEINDFDAAEDFERADLAVSALLGTRFEWTHGRKLEDWIRAFIDTYMDRRNLDSISRQDVFADVSYRFALIVTAAQSETRRDGPRDERRMQSLCPSMAIPRLVDESVRGL